MQVRDESWKHTAISVCACVVLLSVNMEKLDTALDTKLLSAEQHTSLRMRKQRLWHAVQRKENTVVCYSAFGHCLVMKHQASSLIPFRIITFIKYTCILYAMHENSFIKQQRTLAQRHTVVTALSSIPSLAYPGHFYKAVSEPRKS